MIFLESSTSRAVLTAHGAELLSFQLKGLELEYIWQGNDEFWGRHAPVLFPIVGRLKNNAYKYKGKKYEMSQHGFARDKEFEVEKKTENSVTFLLKSDAETQKMYPFDFELRLTYRLEKNVLDVTYDVLNLSEEMYFSIGGHPGFNVPLVEGTWFEDYYLSFMPSKSRTQLPLVGPFIDLEHATLAQTNTDIMIGRELFSEDAIILRTSGQNSFQILSDLTDHGVRLSYEEAPFVGFWSLSEKDAPFVCIEPWWGIADSVDSTGNLEEKYGINYLKQSETFTANYQIEIN